MTSVRLSVHSNHYKTVIIFNFIILFDRNKFKQRPPNGLGTFAGALYGAAVPAANSCAASEEATALVV